MLYKRETTRAGTVCQQSSLESLFVARSKSPDPGTRRAVLELLKRDGPQDAGQLAKLLQISAMAVRQHLYQLQEERLVTFLNQARPLGRPAKMWQLTAEANRFFPDAHAELTIGLVAALGEAFGARGLERILEVRAAKQIADYQQRLPRRASLRRRLESLAEARTEEGYMAEVDEATDGTLLLVENHCPICAAATACTGLCGAELMVFQSVLGDRVEVSRTEHIVQGGRRCVYAVRPARRRK